MQDSSNDAEDIIWSFLPYSGKVQPEWLVLGKPHADRAKQFKPFAALRGYDERIQAVIAEANAADGIFDPFPNLGSVEDACAEGCPRTEWELVSLEGECEPGVDDVP